MTGAKTLSRMTQLEEQLPDEVRQVVDLDPDELVSELARTPGDLARAGNLAAATWGTYRRRKARRERVLGEVLADPVVAAALKEQLGKAPTVDQLKASALADPRFEEALDLEIQADVDRRKAASVHKALAEKAALLVALAKVVSRDRTRGRDPDDEDEEEDDEDDDEKDDDDPER